MNNEGLPPKVGMKKETPLILSGYVVPDTLVHLRYMEITPPLSDQTPRDPFLLIQPSQEPNERVGTFGWYFDSASGENDPFQSSELRRVQEFCRHFVQFLNQFYPIVYKGSRLRWTIGLLNTTLLHYFGVVRIEIQEAYQYPDKFKEGLEAFVGKPVYRVNANAEIRSKERQNVRMTRLKPNLAKLKQYDPDRVERGVKQLMAKEGLSSHNAFLKVIESNEMYNTAAEGVGQAYGPWLNTVHTGGTKKARTRKSTQSRRFRTKNLKKKKK